MGDAEVPPSKKRVAGRQISKDHPESDDDAPDAEMGTFQKASEEVMATRRIVKVRRNNPPAAAPSSNPFAAIRLVPPEDTSVKASDPAEQQETGDTTTSEQTDKSESTELPVGDDGTGICETDNVVEETDESRKTDNVPQESADKANDAIEEKSLPEASNKEGEDEGKNIDHEALEDVDKKHEEETQKEAVEETIKEGGEAKDREENVSDEKGTAPPVSSFGQLSGSKNAFTGLAGPGFSSSSVTFGSLSGEGFSFGKSGGTTFVQKNGDASFSFGTGSGGTLFGQKSGDASFSFGTGSGGSLFGQKNGDASFSFGTGSGNESSSFGLFSNSVDAARNNKPTMQEVPIETGEENEKAVFCADAVLYEYLGGGWKERGKGEIKLNISLEGSEKARLIMRAKGNYRLILNASLYPDMSLANMDKRGITFACVNSSGEAKDGLTTFAVKFKDSSLVEEFRVAVTAHKGKKNSSTASLENPPEGSDAAAAAAAAAADE